MKVNREWLDTRTDGRSSRRLATRSSGLGRSGRRFRPWCDVGEGQCEPRVLLSLSEFRVNEVTLNNQDEARVAVNAVTGDFVVVWESYTQDGWADGVYARRYSVSGVPLGGEFQVHTYTTNAQRNASVAMNAAGDFVVVWQSYTQDGSGYGVYAQRFDASGNPVGGEFQVNTYTTSFQVNPHVAMNGAGDFVVVWQSYTQDGSGYGVYAQRFDASGNPVGGEFQVNTYTTGWQRNPRVAMNAAGDFVVVWESFYQDGSGYGVYAQRFDALGNPVGSEFQVHTYTTNVQRNASVAMNAAGDFVVVWQSYTQDGLGFGVYAQRFDASGNPVGGEFQVNTYTTSFQVNPHVAVNAVTGDFVVVWQSFYQDGSGYGVYAQRFDASGNAVGGEFQVHTYTTSNQRIPHVAMNAAGDFVVAWESDSQDSSSYGVYLARYASSTLPSLLDVMAVHTLDDQLIPLNASLDRDDVSHLVVTFSRQPDSAASNVANWSLSRNGQLQIGAITGVSVSLDPLRNRYVATLSLSGALTPGLYSLEAKPIIRDLNNRGLDGDTNGQAGGAFRHSFRVMSTGKEGDEFQVHTYTTFNQRNAHVAVNAVTGDFVVVWQSFYQDGLGYGVYAQRFDASGNPVGSEFQVNTYTTNNQVNPHVAVNAVTGDFVVVWQSFYQDGLGYGVYAQRFDASGNPVGSEFQVNTYTTNWQLNPHVAMNAAGDFVVVWQSFYQDGSGYGVYAQRFDASGNPVGGEFQVNTYTTSSQANPHVAMNAAGDFVVVWQSFYQDGLGFGVYAQRFDASGNPVGGEFQVNTYTTSSQANPHVAMNAAGDFVVAWQSYTQDGWGYGVYAQRFDASGNPVGGEFQVNTYTTNWQLNPGLAMNPMTGDFVVVWQSFGQDGSGFGVYAQRFDASGNPVGGEFQVNTYTTNWQLNPGLAMNGAGDFVVVWESYSQDGWGYGVYAQRYRPLVAGEFAQVTDVRVNWGSSGNASILALGAASVPVANLNAVEVRFSTDVNVSISDLSLTRQLGGPVTITGFTYDPVTFTARWSFASLGNVADTFTLSLPTTLTTNPGGYPVFATPYQYEFSVVTGDFNGDGVVTIADAQFQRQYLGQNPLLATAAQFYRAFANIDGDTDIDTSDFNLIRARIGFKRPGL
ncbi:VBCS repeat-containing protein [Isosphaera pallida ATCC 43644]|uniref:VBCS repeat-containing protein n=1 Tax=Isosphaera pallida (strain ATCC 43644 / DSM 9630 / IS1B) TaxID=575540 RepID=E8R2W2_ISOPI|nr:dockerin type I repeat-containing protein [Isosphaera pallida]ADV61466.1 VBCS repeat-containing protein [Isosphaera pallida ATCC 43644]